MSSDFLNNDPAIIAQNRANVLSYQPLFGLIPSNRVTLHGRSRTTATIFTSKTLNDFKFNITGTQQNEIYNRKAIRTSYTFTPVVIENEYQETTVFDDISAQSEMDADNLKRFSILTDKCLMVGDEALPSDINTGQTNVYFGNKGFLNADGSKTLPSVLISTPQELITEMTNLAETLISDLEAQPQNVYFIIPSKLRKLWNFVFDGTNQLAMGTINSALSMYGGYTFAESQVYVNPADEDKIIAFIPSYIDLNMAVLPQIYKRMLEDYYDLRKTRYLSGNVGVKASYDNSIVIQPFTES